MWSLTGCCAVLIVLSGIEYLFAIVFFLAILSAIASGINSKSQEDYSLRLSK